MKHILKEALEHFNKVLSMNEDERRYQLRERPEFLWKDEPFVTFCYLLKAEILAFEGHSDEAKENFFKYTEVYGHDVKKIPHTLPFRRVCAKLNNSDEAGYEEEYLSPPNLKPEKEVDWELKMEYDFLTLAQISDTKLPKSHYFNNGYNLFMKSKF